MDTRWIAEDYIGGIAMVIDLDKEKVIGNVESVDTATVIVHVKDAQLLSSIQVNHLVVIRSSKLNQHLIGMVNKIVRKYIPMVDIEDSDLKEMGSYDLVKVTLVGTFITKVGMRTNIFKRTLQSVAEIDAECFTMSSETMSNFMSVISHSSALMDNPLKIGKYVLNDTADAFLDGNKFFQRHAVIAGSTGSGKSFTVATVIEQIEKLKSSNAILFDIHGEYDTIEGDGIKHYKIAGPGDDMADDIMFLPYWLLSYDEMLSLMLDRSDSNAPNQAMLFSRYVVEKKLEYLKKVGKTEMETQFTIDSPIPYDIEALLDELRVKDTEVVPGASAGRTKQGDFYGKLSRFIQRLENKITDKRLNFMFSKDTGLMEYKYMVKLCEMLLAPASKDGGVKIINFSEVPSDVLPLIVSLIARVIFSVQQWVDRDKIHPVALFCDEAHLYIPENARQGVETSSLSSFERIAKEGRKYGVALVVITQRPSEVNRTVLSQANNFIAMRLTNVDDQNVIKKLLPDNLGNYAEMLPILDVGEALIVGDASLLPSRIMVDKPKYEPNSATVNFWDEWSKEAVSDFIENAVESLRKQSK